MSAGDQEAEGVINAVPADPGVQEARARVEAAETELGMELSRLQPFQDRYDQAAAAGDVDGLTELCGGKHGRWGRICVLDDGHETSMEEPHWGRNSEGRPIAWVHRSQALHALGRDAPGVLSRGIALVCV
ncbi:hypothetical protein [Streptomyces sp. NPDC088727]|uniref:hypothetical protein n=1 Tax=Streptomyces sp. NPDC088727 TaxID=3365875 RepID=UPI003808B778